MESLPSNTNTDKKIPACLWMQAGVVVRKDCRSDFLCTACRFDKAMCNVAEKNLRLRKKGIVPSGNKGKIIHWQDKLNEQPQGKRPCIHHMKGRIEFRLCTNDYQCANCEFDQYFYDQHTVHTVLRPMDILDIDGFKIPQGYYLHYGHTWVKMEEGSMVRIGLDDFSLRVLGPPDRIEAPLMGKEVKQDQEDISLVRGDNRATVRSPVSGIVTDINPSLREKGYLANENPYADGWILRVQAKNLRQELRNLMIREESGNFLKKEVDRLYEVVEDAVPLAADGGRLDNDIYGKIPQIGWKTLTTSFLRTGNGEKP